MWIKRDAQRKIISAFMAKQPGVAEEELPDTDPEMVAFLNPPPPDPVDAVDIVLAKAAFNHENRIRILEGKAAITFAQFKTALKAL